MQRQAALAGGERAVDVGGRHARLLKRGHLVFHQGDEGRYHQGDALARQRRDLKAGRLAGARGHDAQSVAPLHDSINQRLLPGAEGAVTEDLPEGFVLIHDIYPDALFDRPQASQGEQHHLGVPHDHVVAQRADGAAVV